MADQVAMKVLDTMHMSNVSADNLVEGDVILVSEADAKNLEDRGLAERGGTAAKAVNTPNPDAPAPLSREALEEERGQAAKAISASPENKMVEPDNKAATSRRAAARKRG
jgi:hypothetical protein